LEDRPKDVLSKLVGRIEGSVEVVSVGGATSVRGFAEA